LGSNVICANPGRERRRRKRRHFLKSVAGKLGSEEKEKGVILRAWMKDASV
jgi:hypothetical protein